MIATATSIPRGLPIPVGSEPGGVAVTSDGSKVYVTNFGDDTVSVIGTASKTVTATIPIPRCPYAAYGAAGVAVTPDGSMVYVTNAICSTVSVIDTARNMVTATIPVPSQYPLGIAVTPDGRKVYVTSQAGGLVTVISTATNTVTATIAVVNRSKGVAVTPDGRKVYVADAGVSVIDTATNTRVAHIQMPLEAGAGHYGVAITPDGRKVYVTNYAGLNANNNNVSVIETATDTVVGSPIPVGSQPIGVAITPDGSKAYVVNSGDNNVSVIDTATNMVVAVPPTGKTPSALGVFIQPRFAGTPGKGNCEGKSISALPQTFGGVGAAAIALGFPTVQGLHAAVNAFCGARICFSEREAPHGHPWDRRAVAC